MNSIITDIGRLKAERNSAQQEIQAARHELERIKADIEYFLAGQRPQNDPALEFGSEAVAIFDGEETPTVTEASIQSAIANSPSIWSLDNGISGFISGVKNFYNEFTTRLELFEDSEYDTVASGIRTTVDRRNAISAQIGLIKKATTGGADLITLISQLHERAEKCKEGT